MAARRELHGRYAEQAQVPLAEFPAVVEWFGRMRELPAWKKTNA